MTIHRKHLTSWLAHAHEAVPHAPWQIYLLWTTGLLLGAASVSLILTLPPTIAVWFWLAPLAGAIIMALRAEPVLTGGVAEPGSRQAR